MATVGSGVRLYSAALERCNSVSSYLSKPSDSPRRSHIQNASSSQPPSSAARASAMIGSSRRKTACSCCTSILPPWAVARLLSASRRAKCGRTWPGWCSNKVFPGKESRQRSNDMMRPATCGLRSPPEGSPSSAELGEIDFGCPQSRLERRHHMYMGRRTYCTYIA